MTNIVITDVDIDQISSSLGLEFDDEHRKILKSLESIDVQACPGSGKTTLIAAKLVILSQKLDFNKDAICVLSHTNVAKDEIIKRIERSNDDKALKLLAYPNFIGTIHEFINKFISLPYLKSMDEKIKSVDDGISERHLYYSLKKVTRDYLQKKWIHDCGGFELCDYCETTKKYAWKFEKFYNKNHFNTNIEAYTNDLMDAKSKSIDEGYYYSNDLIVIAKKCLCENINLSKLIQNRFKFVFIDEMQDASKLQDSILGKIFSSGNILLQRFGDKDQAIFDGMSELNETYNINTPDVIIEQTNRFTQNIANFVSKVSHSKVNIISKVHHMVYSPTLFIYNDTLKLLDNFSNYLNNESNIKNISDKTIKAISWTESGLKKFHPDFNKNIKKTTYLTKTFLQVLKLCLFMRNHSYEFCEVYNIYIKGILKLIKFYNMNMTQTEFIDWLSINSIYAKFKEFSYGILTTNISINESDFNNLLLQVIQILKLNSINIVDNDAYDNFCKYDSSCSLHITLNNQFDFNGVKIDFSTIHGIKGETHDITIVLESPFYEAKKTDDPWYNNTDLKVMLPWILGDKFDIDLLSNVGAIEEKQLMKQLYVAMSRPRHLLCLTINKDNITDDQIQSFKDQGWNIKQC